MRKLKYELLLIVIVAMWGLSFSLTKPLLGSLGVFNFLAIRFVIGSLSLVMLLIYKKRLKFNKTLISTGIKSGIIMFMAYYCQIEGLKYTSIAKNAFIVGSTVVFIPFVVFLKSRMKTDKLTWMQTVMSICGLALITLTDFSSINKGDLMTLVGTFLFAIYTVEVEASVKKFQVDVFTAVQLLTVGALSTVFTLVFETPKFDFAGSQWLTLLFLAVVLTGVFYYLLNGVQQVLSSSNVTLIYTFEPFFAVFFGWIFLREIISIHVFIGGSIIIMSVLLPYILSHGKELKVYE